MEDRESLNNILVDDNERNKSVSIKKVIAIGLVIFSLFIIAIFSMKYLNPPTTVEKVMEKKVQLEPTADNNNLFEPIKVKENSQVSDNFKNVINSIKNKKEAPAKKETPKEEEIFTQKTQTKSISAKRQAKSFIQKGYYVQVGAFYKLTPSDKLLNKIKKSGHTYHLFKSRINNSSYTKVVIGPYETKQEAIAKLPEIKKIEQDAYILALP